MAMLLAMATVPLIGFLGLATDTARAYLVREQLSQALDASALAGAKVIFAEERDDDIRAFFAANYPPALMGSTVTGPTISISDDDRFLTLEASAEVPTTFVRVLGIESIDVSARAVVERELRGMELVLVMDNTGSMRSGGRIGAMRDAARDLIAILYGDDQELEDFFVGVVPYTAMVNIGPGRSGWLDAFDAGAYAPTTWKGCVEARADPHDQSDAPPGDQPFTAAFWPSTHGLYLDAGGQLIGDNDWDAATIDERNQAQNEGLGPNLGCGPPILPLVAARATVEAAIDAMEPWHRGGTMANLGLAWGWRVLSPRWRGLWGGDTPAALPLDYDNPLMDKVIVLLTDGENQWYDWPDGLPGRPDNGSFPDADYTAYGRLSESRLGTSSTGSATHVINMRMSALCTAMKAEGVIIYTITFRVNDSSTQALYRSCATGPEYYFNSPSNAELADSFRQIGAQLSNLRIAE